jgi:hypothetical protein
VNETERTKLEEMLEWIEDNRIRLKTELKALEVVKRMIEDELGKKKEDESY